MNGTIIIGGGLSGCYTAYLLHQQQREYLLLEAAPRLGGRIQTIQGVLDTPLELGATWFSDQHQHLLSLISELGLETYPQFSEGISIFQTKSFEPAQHFYVPASDAPSYRLRGGTSALIHALAEKLDHIKLNATVNAIEQGADEVTVRTSQGDVYHGSNVVICIPPALAATIRFSPALPADLQSLLPSVQTWMAGSSKFTLEYATPFWREKGFSGMLFSHAGIVTEMYDHTNFEGTKFGFTGFLNGGAASYSTEVRQELVLRQLSALLGEEAAHPVSYTDKVWNDGLIQQGSTTYQRPHQHNGHSLLQQSYWNNQLYFCGTETSSLHSGYMEGAVVAAERVVKKL